MSEYIHTYVLSLLHIVIHLYVCTLNICKWAHLQYYTYIKSPLFVKNDIKMEMIFNVQFGEHTMQVCTYIYVVIHMY